MYSIRVFTVKAVKKIGIVDLTRRHVGQIVQEDEDACGQIPPSSSVIFTRARLSRSSEKRRESMEPILFS